ncbi:MAG TPA: hypothetical protein DD473_04635 [Planctomycetaceae bacterium]|nr:hypothetical protein [Planctomycetaceae bacterium]
MPELIPQEFEWLKVSCVIDGRWIDFYTPSSDLRMLIRAIFGEDVYGKLEDDLLRVHRCGGEAWKSPVLMALHAE